MRFDFDFLFLVPVCTLLAILGFLTSRAATVGTSNILLLLGLGLHLLAIVLRLVTSASEVDAVLEDTLKIVHISFFATDYTTNRTVR